MKKRILFIHHSGGLGGAPRSLSYILKSITRNEFEPFLINIAEGPSNLLFEEAGIEPFIVKWARPFQGSTVVSPSFILTIRNWIYLLPSIMVALINYKKIKPDLIHLNSTCLFAFAIAAKLWNRKVPVICHVREPIRNGWQGWPLRFFSKIFINGFIAISKYDLDSLKISPENNVLKSKVIYNFVNQEAFKQSKNSTFFQEKLQIDKNNVIFLYLARFSEANGWKALIEKENEINKTFKNYHFVLAGAPDSFDVSAWETPNIHILSFQKNVELLLQSADVFVCPFTEPHFARGIIEASAAGLPIIASNIGGVNELMVHNFTGYLYNDSNELLHYIQLLGNDKIVRDKLGENGIEFALKNFEFNRNIQLTFKFLKEFI
jgi:glycosyltransferase involved in cell wall biosynthesis